MLELSELVRSLDIPTTIDAFPFKIVVNGAKIGKSVVLPVALDQESEAHANILIVRKATLHIYRIFAKSKPASKMLVVGPTGIGKVSRLICVYLFYIGCRAMLLCSYG